jgi:hypothetical protein
MERAMETTVAVVVGVMSTVGAGVIIGGAKTLISRLSKAEKSTEEALKRSEEIERNYVKRFEEIRGDIRSSEKCILGKIGELSVELAKNYPTREEVHQLLNGKE